MLYSMTAYGSTEKTIGNLQCLVEIKTLNGKQFDVYTKLPQSLKSVETKIRQIIKDKIQRGSVELIINLKQFDTNQVISINTDLVIFYKEKIEQLSHDLKLANHLPLETILGLPDVITSGITKLSEDELNQIVQLCDNACDIVNKERRLEGTMLESTLVTNIKNIQTNALKISSLAIERAQLKKEKLISHLNELTASEKFDANRLEQEIIYYIEKLDISEEQTRLAHHCQYFLEILETSTSIKGKKLGFIAQEIGREINTMGAKANHAEIQKLVVIMKDELEQAKEQLANVL